LDLLLTVLLFGSVVSVVLGFVLAEFLLDGTFWWGEAWFQRLRRSGGYLMAAGLAIIALFVAASGPWGEMNLSADAVRTAGHMAWVLAPIKFLNVIGPYNAGLLLLWLAYKAHRYYVGRWR
jgi:hypothetical protein